MKYKKALSVLLALVLTVSLSSGAFAAQWEDFTDVSGHWAEETMRRAFADGLLTGDDFGHMNPDAAITGGEMAAILTRVLNADQKAPLEGYNVPVSAWYYEAAEKAAYLGIIGKSTSLAGAVKRQDAFVLLARAFALGVAAPDYTALNAYSDHAKISPENRSALAAMAASGLVQGSDGALNANGSISRAEFMTILYRIAPNYIIESELSSDLVGGCVVNGTSAVYGVNQPSGVWYGCQNTSVNIGGGTLATLTLRCNALPALNFSAATSVGVLNLACVNGSLYSSPANLTVGTLRLTNIGEAVVGDWAKNVEVLPDWKNVVITGVHDTVVVSGSNNQITVPDGGSVGTITVNGANNHITVGGVASNIVVNGTGTIVDGTGSASSLFLNVKGTQVTLPAASITESFPQIDYETALSSVTTGYTGDYTLAWAENHDYTDEVKEAWINGKGYSSQTQYIIWVSLAMQRVNIFEGSQGSFKLIRSSIVGTGAPGSGTPVGTYTTTYKQAAGWTTSSYTCRPVVGFKLGTGYAFHSRLYYPNSTKLKDASIGYPISHGCVRMYDEDVNYIFDNIPVSTTVVVY